MKPWMAHCQSHFKRCLKYNMTSSQRPWKLPSVLHLFSSLGPNSGLLTLISDRVLVFYVFNTPLLTLCILAFLYNFSSFFFISHFTGCLGWGLSNLTLRPKKLQLQCIWLPASDKEKEQIFKTIHLKEDNTRDVHLGRGEFSKGSVFTYSATNRVTIYILLPKQGHFCEEKKRKALTKQDSGQDIYGETSRTNWEPMVTRFLNEF